VIALVTGASRGIGRLGARAGRRGAHVIAAARTVGGLEELDDAIKALGGDGTLVPLDLKDLRRHRPLGPAIEQRWGKLDILVGNAGVLGTDLAGRRISTQGCSTRPSRSTSPPITGCCARSIRCCARSDAGRVVMLSSGAARRVRAYWGCYAASKAALEALVRAYAGDDEHLCRARDAGQSRPDAATAGMRASAASPRRARRPPALRFPHPLPRAAIADARSLPPHIFSKHEARSMSVAKHERRKAAHCHSATTGKL
jgi:NAD(P)-dependent dehydrogenase (short-subunit alcohol dehydrogenase family)